MPNSNTLDQSGVASTVRSDTYYYDTVVFEVEGTVYRVCKYGFEKYSRSVFRDMFSLPQGLGETREGETDDKPIQLVGCNKIEFESLLEVIQPRRLVGPRELCKQQWIDVLRLGRMWDMPEVAVLAIERIEIFGLNPIEKILLGNAHGVPTWLKDGYVSLVEAQESQISLQQMEKLGWETACRVLWARNQMQPTIRPPQLGDLFCGSCLYNGRKESRMTQKLDGSPCCDKCKANPDSGYDTYLLVKLEDRIRRHSKAVTDIVGDVFGADLKEAELRSAARSSSSSQS